MHMLIMLFLLMFFCTMCLCVGPLNIAQLPDPFAMPPRQGCTSSRAVTVGLEGIIEIEGKPCAALVCGDDHEMVPVGSVFKGYTLITIEKESVCLEKEGKTKTLTLD